MKEPHNTSPFDYASPSQQYEHEEQSAPQPTEDPPPLTVYWPSNTVTAIVLSLALIAVGMWAFAQILAVLH